MGFVLFYFVLFVVVSLFWRGGGGMHPLRKTMRISTDFLHSIILTLLDIFTVHRVLGQER